MSHINVFIKALDFLFFKIPNHQKCPNVYNFLVSDWHICVRFIKTGMSLVKTSPLSSSHVELGSASTYIYVNIIVKYVGAHRVYAQKFYLRRFRPFWKTGYGFGSEPVEKNPNPDPIRMPSNFFLSKYVLLKIFRIRALAKKYF